MSMPKFSHSQSIGSRAVAATQKAFVDHRWLFRPQEGTTDFGIDCEVEVTDDTHATGKIFKAQIKGQEATTWRDGLCSVQVLIRPLFI